MMFLIRTAFWLVVLVLLLPTDKDQQNQIYGTAQTAVSDFAGFCDRNPQTCVASQEAFAVLVQKAQYGAGMLMGLVETQTANFGDSASFGDSMPSAVAMPGDPGIMPVPAAAPLEPTTWDTTATQDTLSAEDRETAWGGPGI